MPDRVYFHREAGSWQPQDVHERSVVAQALASREAGEPWDDGYGHEYKWEPADG